VTPYSVGALIALYDRAVGFYGSLVNINAYHQPGVEGGKKAAGAVLALQGRVLAALGEAAGYAKSAEDIAANIDADPEAVFHVLNHLAATRLNVVRETGGAPGVQRFRIG
jgi:glucose-6-phosphate isomerase